MWQCLSIKGEMHYVALRKRGGLVQVFGSKHTLLLSVRLQAAHLMSDNKVVDHK